MSKRESGLDPCVLFRFTCAALAAAPVLADAQQPAATGERALEEIVVTANRREERLQDVGISVTALGSASLSNLNITTATDITRAVPSLKMNAYSSSQVVFNIRGVAQNSYGDEQEPPVAVYQDDSYSSSINLASFPVFDLERVEALRGPQGTLFGRNARRAARFSSSHAGRPRSSKVTGPLPSDASINRSSKEPFPDRSPTAGRDELLSSATRTTASSRTPSQALKTSAPMTITPCADNLPGSRPMTRTSI